MRLVGVDVSAWSSFLPFHFGRTEEPSGSDAWILCYVMSKPTRNTQYVHHLLLIFLNSTLHPSSSSNETETFVFP